MKFISQSPEETIVFGKKIAKLLKRGDIVCLFGELGSGKTTFVKGLAVGLRVKKDLVNSPSFVLVKEFKGRLPLFHFDLYRMKSLREIFSLGFEEYLFGRGICVIEWAEKLSKVSLNNYRKIEFKIKGPKERLIKVSKRVLSP